MVFTVEKSVWPPEEAGASWEESLTGRNLSGQLNAGSLTGAFGRSTRRVAEILLRHGLAHVVASDGHPPVTRPCRLDQAFAIASRTLGLKAALRAVRDIPCAMVRAEAVRLEAPERYTPRPWFLFGRVGRVGV